VPVSYIDPNILTLTYGAAPFSFKSDDALAIGNVLLRNYAVLTYRVPNPPVLRVDSTPLGVLAAPRRLESRPPSLLQRHIVAFAHYYQTQFQIQGVRAFHDWDRSPTPVFRLTSAFPPGGAAMAVAHAISWDNEIKELFLEKLAPDVLPSFISTLLEESLHLTLISFED
jgi:hypothetical protein